MYTSIQKIMVAVNAFIFSIITLYMIVSNLDSLKNEWSLQEISFYFVLFIIFAFQTIVNYEFLKNYKLSVFISSVFMGFSMLCIYFFRFI